MFLADFHIHSNFSDGVLSIPELIDFYGERGFGAIAITDHLCEVDTILGKAAVALEKTLTPEIFSFYLKTLHEEKQRAWDQYRMVVFSGVEVTKNSLFNHRSAHVLGIGIHEYISPDQDVRDIARTIRAQDGIAVAAHPVDTGKFEPQTYHLWSRREELRKEFDAWEVASGTRLFQPVIDERLPMIANSDLHHPRQMTSWKTVLECERHPEAILDAIRKQRLTFRYYNDEVTAFLPPLLNSDSLERYAQ